MIYFANIALFGFNSVDVTLSYTGIESRSQYKSFYKRIYLSDFAYSDSGENRKWLKDRWGLNHVT